MVSVQPWAEMTILHRSYTRQMVLYTYVWQNKSLKIGRTVYLCRKRATYEIKHLRKLNFKSDKKKLLNPSKISFYFHTFRDVNIYIYTPFNIVIVNFKLIQFVVKT
jgi:hypothetical protein